MKKYIYIIGFCALGIFTLNSCQSDFSSQLKSIPTAIGKTNEIVVIAEDPLWESMVGDSFNYYFGGPYPIMPNPEPLFDIRHFSPEYLFGDESRQALRTYSVLVDVNNRRAQTTKMAIEDIGEEAIRRFQESAEPNMVKIGRNKWAKNQLIAYIVGKGPDALAKGIADNFPQIASKINEHDKSQIEARAYAIGTHIGMGTRILERYGIEVVVPDGFDEAIADDDITWLRKETNFASMNLLFSKMPYESKDQLTAEGMIELRNELTKAYVSSETAGSYMVINDEDLPVFSYVRDMGGNYALEIRGVWEMTDDFMGGPFFSWLILNEQTSEVIFVDAFVLAPGEDKRDVMQQLNYIIENAKFPKQQ